MKVYKIGHASLIVETRDVRCLMDPILTDPFECGTVSFEPPTSIDPGAIGGQYNLVVISHEHMDHFCIKSLNLLQRNSLVLFPRGCELIELALRAMGFREVKAVVPGESFQFRDLDLTFTPSAVSFPEMGVLFASGGQTVWNCVDTELDEPAISLVRQRTPRVDVMFAQYQALIEVELGIDGLGSSFPYEKYGRRLSVVTEVLPRCVVPGSCGYRYFVEPWLNHRGFPISEAEFIEDIKAIAKDVTAISVPAGGVLDVATLSVRENALPFVSTIEGAPRDVLDWRPDREVSPLRDDDPVGHGTEKLRARLDAYLGVDFLAAMDAPRLGAWRDRMAAGGVVWQLEITYPDGCTESRYVDFTGTRLAWLTSAPRSPKLVTAICASSLAGLTSGEVTPYRAGFTRRVVVKLYAPSRLGVTRFGSAGDDPVMRVLFPGANRRFVEAQLRELGYAPRRPDSVLSTTATLGGLLRAGAR